MIDQTLQKGLALFVIFMVLMAAWLAIAPMFADLAVEAATSVDSSHAVVKHGSDASIARKCTDGRGGYLFHNPNTNRYGIVCLVDNKWGIVIQSSTGDEVTAFVKNKMRDFKQVLKYMENAGYDLIQ